MVHLQLIGSSCYSDSEADHISVSMFVVFNLK